MTGQRTTTITWSSRRPRSIIVPAADHAKLLARGLPFPPGNVEHEHFELVPRLPLQSCHVVLLSCDTLPRIPVYKLAFRIGFAVFNIVFEIRITTVLRWASPF